MKARITTILTTALLVAGTGGAIALGESGSHSSPQGGAASGQYKPGKGCGDKNHKHKKHGQCHAPKKKHKAKHVKKTQKPKSTKPGNSSCTIKKQGSLTLVYCP